MQENCHTVFFFPVHIFLCYHNLNTWYRLSEFLTILSPGTQATTHCKKGWPVNTLSPSIHIQFFTLFAIHFLKYLVERIKKKIRALSFSLVILITFSLDGVSMLLGENWFWSLLGQRINRMLYFMRFRMHHLHISHNAPYLPPPPPPSKKKKLHKQLQYPGEMKNKGYAKFWGANKVHYGRRPSGILPLMTIQDILRLMYFWRCLMMAFIRNMVKNLFLSFMAQVILCTIRS